MKNISLFVLTIVVACNPVDNINEREKELEKLIIKKENKETSFTVRDSDDKNNEYFIKPLSDSTYTGTVEEKYPNGIVKYKGFYRFGKRHGEWLYFYPNGNLWSEAEYNRDKMHGKSKVYYPNGLLFYSGFYKNNLKDSVWTYYDTSGKEVAREIYKNGKPVKVIIKK